MVIKKAIEILLIEDNPNDVELTLRALKRNNIVNDVHVISDGEEAINYFFGEDNNKKIDLELSPKLIILDLKLPKVDGLEILRRLKLNKDTRTIPVVILTSSKEESDIVSSYQLGANSFIVKPVDFDKFINTVNEIGLYWLILNEPPKL